MLKWQLKTRVLHPEWLDHSHPETAIALFKAGKLPQNVAGWMLVVGLKHPLRAVYGSDLRAAWALLWWAIADRLDGYWVRFQCRVIWKIFGEPKWMADLTDEHLYTKLNQEIFGDRKQTGQGSDESSS
jgi:hypothetical protein